MKLLAETTNNTMVHSLAREGSLEADRPGVVVPTILIDRKIASGEVRVIGRLSDEATDAAFVDALVNSKGDTDLAIEAFLAEFELSSENKDRKAPPVLLGSDHLPSKVEIHGEAVSLGEIVAAAAAAMEPDAWNKLPQAERETLLNAEIAKRTGTPAPIATPKGATKKK
jgi:hypothetical protein